MHACAHVSAHACVCVVYLVTKASWLHVSIFQILASLASASSPLFFCFPWCVFCLLPFLSISRLLESISMYRSFSACRGMVMCSPATRQHSTHPVRTLVRLEGAHGNEHSAMYDVYCYMLIFCLMLIKCSVMSLIFVVMFVSVLAPFRKELCFYPHILLHWHIYSPIAHNE